MKYLLVFCVILRLSGIYGEDPICNGKQRLANPRECCLDPKLITNQIIEKCRIRTGHITLEQHSFDNMIKDQNTNTHQFEHNQFPSSIGNVQNRIRDTKQTINSFNLNNGDDSDEKSSSNIKGSSYEQHNIRHMSHNEKEYNDDHDSPSSESNSLDDSSSESDDRNKHHHGGHRHNCDRHKHNHRRQHHGRHHCKHSKYQINEYKQQIDLHFHKFSCFMECVINETGIIENKTVNMYNVNTYLTEMLQLNDEYLPIVTDAFDTCSKNIAVLRQKIKEIPVMPLMPLTPLMPHAGYKNNLRNSEKCRPWSGYLMMCIKAQLFMNCPADNFRNDDIKCHNTREFMKSCPKQSARIPYYSSFMAEHYSRH